MTHRTQFPQRTALCTLSIVRTASHEAKLRFIHHFRSNRNAFYLCMVTSAACSSTPYYVHAWLYKGCGCLCPEGLCPGVSLSRGSLYREVSLSREMSLSRGSLSRVSLYRGVSVSNVQAVRILMECILVSYEQTSGKLSVITCF